MNQVAHDFFVNSEENRLEFSLFEVKKIITPGILMICFYSEYIDEFEISILKDKGLLSVAHAKAFLGQSYEISNEYDFEMLFLLPDEVNIHSGFIREVRRSVFLLFNLKNEFLPGVGF